MTGAGVMRRKEPNDLAACERGKDVVEKGAGGAEMKSRSKQCNLTYSKGTECLLKL